MRKIHILKFAPILLVILCLLLPQTVFAHAILQHANPGQGSHLDKSPDQIVLTFNEYLGDDLYKLKVKDKHGQTVTKNQPKLSQKHRKVKLNIPKLDDGVYTVTYKVISADGHPVDSSYTFSVGDVSNSASVTNVTNNIRQSGESHSAPGYVIRSAYFLALLFLTGWLIWGIVFRMPNPIRQDYDRVLKTLKIIYLFMLIGYGFVTLSHLLSDLGDDKIISLFTSSNVGAAWLISLLVAVSGFWLLGFSKWLDGLFVILLLGAQSINGHAFAFQPRAVTIALDFAHLLGAAIWSGGLLYLIYFWKKHSNHLYQFLPLFSKAALISIIALVCTGVLNTVFFLPRLSDVFLTWWGRLLLLKVTIVIVIIITAVFIRSALKKKQVASSKSRIKVDFTMMILTVIIAAVFTMFNPRPVNKPFTWQETDNQITMTTNITPKLPQTANTFTVRIHADAKPNEVTLAIRDKSNEESSSLNIALQPAGQKKDTYVYQTEKGNIPFSGLWQVTVRILDHEDNFTKLQKDMRVYRTDL